MAWEFMTGPDLPTPSTFVELDDAYVYTGWPWRIQRISLGTFALRKIQYLTIRLYFFVILHLFLLELGALVLCSSRRCACRGLTPEIDAVLVGVRRTQLGFHPHQIMSRYFDLVAIAKTLFFTGFAGRVFQ